jgi:putative AlgH/UPF0301 family transcriptional regulator
MKQGISNAFNGHAGKLLVSRMSLTGTLDDVFHRAVIFVLTDNQDGTVGVDLAHPETARRYNGGPVEEIVILYKKEKDQWAKPVPNAEFAEYIDSFSSNPTAAQINSGKIPQVQKLFSGITGWDPYQLQFEIDHGFWHAIDATEALVFNTPAEHLFAICERVAGLGPAP